MPNHSDHQDDEFIRIAIDLAAEHMRAKAGGPFGALIVRGSEILARGWNKVTSTNDPTAHAEIVAIREASAAIGSFSLEGCVLYTSCEPCPMCLAAAYWARIDRIVFAADRKDAAAAGFDDEQFYVELGLPISQRRILMVQKLQQKAVNVFDEWKAMPDKTLY